MRGVCPQKQNPSINTSHPLLSSIHPDHPTRYTVVDMRDHRTMKSDRQHLNHFPLLHDPEVINLVYGRYRIWGSLLMHKPVQSTELSRHNEITFPSNRTGGFINKLCDVEHHTPQPPSQRLFHLISYSIKEY